MWMPVLILSLLAEDGFCGKCLPQCDNCILLVFMHFRLQPSEPHGDAHLSNLKAKNSPFNHFIRRHAVPSYQHH